jgi:hypothetical protein
MARPAVTPDSFAFRTSLTFRKDAKWPGRIWEALAAAAKVKGPVQEAFFGDGPRSPKTLDGTWDIGANVLATKKAQGWNPQLVRLSFAAFDPRTGKVVGWSGDLEGKALQAWCGGYRVVDGRPDQSAPVRLPDAFLKKLQAAGKKLAKR